MKRLKKYVIPIMVCLLLQTAVTIGVQSPQKVYAENEPVAPPPMTTVSPELTMPPPTPTIRTTATATPTMPLAVIVKGNIKTEISCSQEAGYLINAGFTVKGGYAATTDKDGAFFMSVPYLPYVIDITIEKPGFLKRTLEGININRQTTMLNDILMWAGDMDGDGAVNMTDIIYIAGSFNSVKGDSIYKALADINGDSTVNMMDIMAVARHFNATSKSYPEYGQVISTPTGSLRPTLTSTVKPKPTPAPDLGLEIERKFLVNPSRIPYDLSTLDKYDILQTYINFSPEIRIRKINGWMFMLTVKAAVDYDGMVREERELWMTEQVYITLYSKREGNDINKTRYQGIGDDGIMFAIDIFKGSLKGLAYYEVEFATEQEANSYVPPAWVGKDVTSDKRYKNGSLAKNGLPADYTPAP